MANEEEIMAQKSIKDLFDIIKNLSTPEDVRIKAIKFALGRIGKGGENASRNV